MHHLRLGTAREWDEFPETAESDALELPFDVAAKDRELTLLVRQQDVKQLWNVLINDRVIAQLTQDENDLTLSLAIPSEALVIGMNRLRIEPQRRDGPLSDDIRIGPILLYDQSLKDL